MLGERSSHDERSLRAIIPQGPRLLTLAQNPSIVPIPGTTKVHRLREANLGACRPESAVAYSQSLKAACDSALFDL